MKKLKLTIAAAALGLTVLVPTSSPAMTCDDSIDEVCAVAAQVICKVVAKGQPCLM